MVKLSPDVLQTIARLAVKQQASYDELLHKLAEVCKDLSDKEVDTVLADIRTAVMGESKDAVSQKHYNTLLYVNELEGELQGLAEQLGDCKFTDCSLAALDKASMGPEQTTLKIRYDDIKASLKEERASADYSNAVQHRKRQMSSVRNLDVKNKIQELFSKLTAGVEDKEDEKGVQIEKGNDSESDDEIAQLLKELDEDAVKSHEEPEAVAAKLASPADSSPLRAPAHVQHIFKLGKKAKQNIEVLQKVRMLKDQKHILEKQIEEMKANRSPAKKVKDVRVSGRPGRRISNGTNRRTKNEAHAYLYLAIFGPFLEIFKLGMSKNKVYELIRHYTRCVGPCALLWRVRIIAKDSINMARGNCTSACAIQKQYQLNCIK